MSTLLAGMRVTPRIRLVRPLARGGMSRVWVGHHDTLNIDVAVKFLRKPLDAVHRQRLVREAQFAVKLQHPNAVQVLDQGHTPAGEPFLVMEFVEGESLQRLLADDVLSLDEALSVVEQLAGVLDSAHELGIVHRDVKPANVILVGGREALRVKLIDFGIARGTQADDMMLTADGFVMGTPSYMAPEQLIGGKQAGPTADLWGLAVVAYECITGQRPFRGPTRGSIGASMVMNRVETPSSVVDNVPSEIDVFFARALALEPEMRFQSGRELVEAFAVAVGGRGTAEVPVVHRRALVLPSRVYGRDREIALLHDHFRKAAGGRARLALVSGYSGIGKTALVDQLRLRSGGAGATFIGGKFDQFDRGSPYQRIVLVLRRLLQQRMSAGTDEIRRWGERVRHQVGDAASALVEEISELEQLVGEVPTPEPLGATEARNRFQHAIARLIGAMASAEEPLILFFDDLQWADLPSLELIAHLLRDPQFDHVLLVGAYRDNELVTGHPLLETLEVVRAEKDRLLEIALGPLAEDAVLDFVSDALPGAAGRVRLAKAVFAKTRGNAFFMRRLLESLAETGVISYDDVGQRWTWDEGAIDPAALSSDVVEFVSAEMHRIPRASRHALAVAACIGDSFDLWTLAHVLRCGRQEALDRLAPCLRAQLITGDTAGVAQAGEAASLRMLYRFAHDRIRQVARQALGDEETEAVHWRAGRYLLDFLDASERERRFFEIVDHLNRGFETHGDAATRVELLRMNVDAARRAIRSAAFTAGDQYFRIAQDLLDESAWQVDYSASLAIHVEGARAAYLTGDYERMGQLVDEAVSQARDTLDRVAAQEVRIQAKLSQQSFLDVIRLTVDALAEIGLELDPSPTGEDVQAAVGETLGLLRAIEPERLARLPLTDDPVVLAQHRLQTGATSAAYMAAPNLLPMMACNIVRSTLEQGVTKHSPYGFATVGLVLNAVKLIDDSYAIGRIATQMLDRIGDRTIRPRTMHLVNSHINLFVDPIITTVEADKTVTRIGLDVGDLEYAAWALHCGVCNGFYAGMSLDALDVLYERNHATLDHHQQLAALGCTLQYGQVLDNLRGKAADLRLLTGAHYDEGMLEQLRAMNFRGAAFIVGTLGTWLRYLFGDPADAVAFADQTGEYADGAPATYHEVWWHQYRALAVLATVEHGSDGVLEALASVEPNLALLRTWASFSEQNHAHRLALVEAEVARVQGDYDAAHANYDIAREKAVKNGFGHERALALELQSRCWREQGEQERGRARLGDARAAWMTWGATAKAEQLVETGD